LSDEAALDRIRELCGGDMARRCASWVQVAASWPGACPLLERISNAGGRNQILDCLCEVRYGLVFDHLGFEVTVEPSGRKGPDFGVSRDGMHAMLEVSRFTLVNSGPPAWADAGLLTEYGNPQDDMNKALAKIQGKYRQLLGDLSILALWNDDEALEDLEVQFAAQTLIDDSQRPESLQFILYGSPWLSTLLCFPLPATSGYIQSWIDDLRAVAVRSAWVV